MKRFMTPGFGKKLLIASAVILPLSYVISLALLWNIYGQAGEVDAGNSPSLAFRQIASKLNVVLSIFGYAALGLGVIILVAAHQRKK
jgi:hypothetical protein